MKTALLAARIPGSAGARIPARLAARSAALLILALIAAVPTYAQSDVSRPLTLSARAIDVAFGSVLTCRESIDSVGIENDGSDGLMILGISATGNDGFSFTVPQFPITLRPGQILWFPLTFAPLDTASARMLITFHLADAYGVGFGEGVTATATGQGRRITARAHIDRFHHGRAGDTILAEVVLDDDLSEARIERLNVMLRYSTDVLQDDRDRYLGEKFATLLDSTLVSNWGYSLPFAPTLDPADPRMQVVYATLTAPPGGYLRGPGVILRHPFVIVDPDSLYVEMPADTTEIWNFLTPAMRLSCVEIVGSNGRAWRDGSDKPGVRDLFVVNDPVTRDLDIEFILDDRGDATIELFDLSGARVLVEIHALSAGRRHVTLVTGSLSVGQYVLRVRAADGSQAVTKVMIAP